MEIREYRPSDRVWAEEYMEAEWGGPLQARRGDLVDVLDLPGFVAEQGGRPVGIATYRLDGDECELAFIAALEQWRGIGTALLGRVREAATGSGRIWLVTTNDNLDALRFYQRRGFRLAQLRSGAVDRARETLKPRIPQVGAFGVAIRDELELELDLRA